MFRYVFSCKLLALATIAREPCNENDPYAIAVLEDVCVCGGGGGGEEQHMALSHLCIVKPEAFISSGCQ